ncbi:aconitase X catalytic domain-containing protein [Fervidicoccus fontis]|uniref:Phosphomevalonate dehydratase large subunit n=2 Tax=Fervidicoccus fontis TaxID=683846 RepID=I0A251_FERFK|nr:aconitase X catalytic domain-containing protein [Fervidicoccus fontis]AFH43058.1 hypothetical protein FFONT_1070 [Fervidicoccus fontis Kam940]MBE9391389.1 aconitase X catalytic domain-containing protein [Fervidicoccus fontis]
MFLTKEEESILNGAHGEIKALALKTIIKIGESLNAERLVDVSHVHASGLSYLTIGDAGLVFIESVVSKNAKVKVFSTLNPVGMDLDDWKKMGISEDFAEKQKRIVELVLKLGFDPTFTCTPYLIRKPFPGEHLAWGESSAVGMANTYYGAYTNREGGPITILSAIVGKIYEAGLHLKENRVPTVEIIIDGEIDLTDPSISGALGIIVGEKIKSGIPLFKRNRLTSFEAIKSYTAAVGANGDIAMSVIDGITPEYKDLIKKAGELEKVHIDANELKEIVKDSIDYIPDVVLMGCPHADLEEILNFSIQIKDCKKINVPVIISTSRYVSNKLNEMGLLQQLEEKGVIFIKDTCPVVSPFVSLKFKNIVTVSGKSLFYLPRMHDVKVAIVPFNKVGEVVCRKK